MIFLAVAAGLALCAPAAAAPAAEPDAASPGRYAPPAGLEAALTEIAARANIGGLGLAVIRDGAVVWTGYRGEQAPGVPVSAATVFNTASVAKTVIAETVLRLADRGRLSLDDPIADHYRHPDLADDPRYAALTPRIILSHQAALRNWPHNYDDGRLAFIGEPGSGEITYSGAGIRILAHYLEARLGATYPEIVERTLFAPLGIDEVEIHRADWLEGRVAHSRDAEGANHPPFTRQPGSSLIAPGEWSAADNLFATVPGYAELLVALIAGEGLSEEMAAERQRLHSASDEFDLGYACRLPEAECPDPLGFGLGWALFGEPGRMVLNHGGNDFGEHAQVYFAPETGDGLVLFMTGGNAFEAGLEIIELVDPDLRMARHYRALFEKLRRREGEGS